MEKQLKVVTPKLVYQWVKTGHWNQRQFLEWAMDHYNQGYDDAKTNYSGQSQADAFDRLKMSGHG